MFPSLDSILITANELGKIVDDLKYKLLDNPNEASSKLAEVLGELGQILVFVESETISYLEIIFLPDKSNYIECRSALLRLESGYVTIKGYEARGHCHKITNIYDKYLDRWFSKVLDEDEAQKIKDAFNNMNAADFDMVQGIVEITQWLKKESEEVLDMIDVDSLDDANQRIKRARKDVQLARREIVESLARLKLLQASFISSSQTV